MKTRAFMKEHQYLNTVFIIHSEMMNRLLLPHHQLKCMNWILLSNHK
jgi:hypothetical protein